ncbi:hypothetical protein JOF42_000354 [Microbacterium phyllosphaerae]|uniref:Uncharacterized protein n=1 Tax=Microbacterium phyllosphaerae TaxID=124798 RepID=A0ABS4WKY7_9MICO|nr:hypothetical protein [Microbacterium phyllosphaerae]
MTVQIDWSSGEEVYAPAWSGLVETVGLSIGQTLDSGQVVGIVGGIQRLAIHTDRPFARSLGPGDQGADVTALNAVLASRKLEHGDGDRFNASTRQGVRALAKALGVPGAADVTRFEPDWVLYLPATTITVKELSLRPGAPAPAAGEAIIVGEERIVTARIVDGATEQPDPAGDAEADGSSPRGIAVVAEENETLLVAGQELALSSERDSLDSAAFATLEATVEPASSTVAGVLQQPPAAGEWVVPTGAILSGKAGTTCVVTKEAGKPAVTSVAVTGQGSGVTVITGELTDASAVLLAPPAQEYSCI